MGLFSRRKGILEIKWVITRPRRFGKTLNMSMLEKFFSVNFANRGELCCGRLLERFIGLGYLMKYFGKK